MVFGLSAAERGSSSAVAVIKPLFAIARAAGKTVTSESLRAPYMLGLLVTLIALEAEVATGGKARSRRGEVVLASWSRITGDDHAGIAQLMHDLAVAKDTAFNEGADDAVKLVRLLHGKPTLDDSDTAEAIESARRLEGKGMMPAGNTGRAAFEARMRIPSSRYATASMLLWTKLFVDRLPTDE